MARCLHLERNGRQCAREAEEGVPFCAWHAEANAAEALPVGYVLRRWIFRVAAVALLGLFLIPLLVEGWRVLRSLLRSF